MPEAADVPLLPVKMILCAVDLSDITAHVLSMAAEVAESYEAKLLVVHVVEIWDDRYDFVVADLARHIEAETSAKLKQELERLGKTSAVPVEVLIAKGAPAVRIIEAIRDRRPELVVMGKHGRRGIDRLLLGSVTDKIVRTSPCSVLVVKPAHNPDIKTVVCAVDFSPASRYALRRAIEIARLDKCGRVKVLNIFELPLGYMEAGMTYESALDRIEKAHLKKMDELLASVPEAESVCDPVVREGSPAVAIAEYAKEIDADLIVTGSHGRSSLAALLVGGTSLRIVSNAQTSVLAIKAPGSRESLWTALDKL